LIVEALAAVIVPSFSKAGLSCGIFIKLHFTEGPSSSDNFTITFSCFDDNGSDFTESKDLLLLELFELF
jgi:hypothetical protein